MIGGGSQRLEQREGEYGVRAEAQVGGHLGLGVGVGVGVGLGLGLGLDRWMDG